MPKVIITERDTGLIPGIGMTRIDDLALKALNGICYTTMDVPSTDLGEVRQFIMDHYEPHFIPCEISYEIDP